MQLPGWTARRKSFSFVVFISTLVALVAAPAGWAHSVLLSTEPANDAVVAEAPEHVELRFDEPVDTALGSIRVYDGSGERVDSDEIERPEPEVVTGGIEGPLEDGTYTVTWRAISADSDPISGAFVFHVGAPGAQPTGIAEEVDQGTSGVVSFVYPATRFVDYVLLLLCAGGAIILALVLGMAAPAVRRRLYLALAAFAGCLAVIALAGLVLQGAYAAGLSLGGALDWDVVSAVSGTRYGEMALLRAGLAVALALTAIVLARRGAGRLGAIACIALGVALLVTPVASGHASVSGPVAFVADYAHILAASAWTGGLAFLVAALLLARTERWSLASRSVPRFSNVAVGAVGILIAAGAVNGYLQVKAFRGLWDTEYGVLLMVKVALVLPLLALGGFNNKFAVPKLKDGSASPVQRRRFLRAVGLELTIMTVIVGVTAVLVNAAPAYKLVAMHGGPVSETLELGSFEAHVTVEPAMPGPNTIMADFGHEDAPDEVVAFATLESEEIGPLRYPLEMEDDGVFVTEDAQLTIPGEWELRIEARKGEFDLYAETIMVQIGE